MSEEEVGVRSAGILYVVATPIGNLEDITMRAVRILGEVDLIASEDTRHTKKLLSHLKINTPLKSYYKGKEESKSDELIRQLHQGLQVALVSDAGTPGISDPGSILVRKAREEGIRVVPIPGPAAVATAFSVAGFEGGFVFLGFLPSKANQRRKMLTAIASEQQHLIFYESPHRITQCLGDCLDILGDRLIFIGREMTKLHEELIRSTVAAALADFADRTSIKGEFVVVVEGAGKEEQPSDQSLKELLIWYRDQSDLSLSDAVKKIAKDLNLARSVIYKDALALWDEA
ncbi:MAG: 16S rRNA (cytidine(1402)-2'-O)-methyltransferase [Desulfobulbaceae bacterium]|nr:16S rRNA (cytidine(1402)-2'-O)-methyltransferase [Desulfobulbaceae bacterium]